LQISLFFNWIFVEKLLGTIVTISSVAYLTPFLKREKKKRKRGGSCVGTWRRKQEGDGPPDVYFGTLNLNLSF
jgi:hypothetical protein